MLGRMKGQSQSMYSNADKLCKKQFKVEFSIYTDAIKWSFGNDRGRTRVELEPHDEYEVTSGKFVFAEKSCNEVKSDDFKPPVELTFNQNSGSYIGIGWGEMRCARALSFQGRYK